MQPSLSPLLPTAPHMSPLLPTPPPQTVTLSILEYYPHWSLLITSPSYPFGSLSEVHELTGDQDLGYTYVFRPSFICPPDPPPEKHTIATFSEAELKGVREAIRSVQVPGPTLRGDGKNCQDWVVGCLERICEDYGGLVVSEEVVDDWRSKVGVRRRASEGWIGGDVGPTRRGWSDGGEGMR
ncbi:hypothetical protein P7C70_g5408, partial [Phenoliferia sp. Uapishka_3]